MPKIPEKENKNTEVGYVKPREIVMEMKESYIDYAMSVIVARALPDVRDGLKPVHRRILYAMHEDGLTHGAKFRKSATVVGSTLGRYHPHGDIAVYDTMARMAQNFSLRYTLIQGQGNFGCFAADTKIKLADGRDLSFADLIKEHERGKRNFTFTMDENNLVKIAEIKNPRKTIENAQLVRVILDNGEEIRCTPNHRFMLKDGSYREAKDLTPKDPLMSLLKFFSNKKPAFRADSLETAHNAIVLDCHPITIIANQQSLSSENSTCKLKAVESTGFAPVGSWVTIQNRHYALPTANQLYQNHKIIKIKILSERQDVYDLTINKTHNFLLAAGVFVHNSIDGDPPAAQRYTEARLSKIGEEMLQDIGKNTVDFIDNYDGSRKEPTVLPSPVPQLLLNGSLGIAVGMATNIPPHNLSEVIDACNYLIDHPKADTEDLFQFIKGPDFPTGGSIYDQKTIIEAYSQGKGVILTRGKAEVVENEKIGRNQIIISEIPFQTLKTSFIEQLANLVQEKKLDGVKDIRDESDKDGMRIVIDLQKDAYPQKVLNFLYKFTDLQRSFHMNMLALVDGIQPRILSLPEVLSYYLEHRRQVIFRRTEYDLSRAKERAHILEGLAKCLAKIDAVIKTIKQSASREDALKNLMKRFKLTQIQANAILETKLSALARLERQKIEEELRQMHALIKEYAAILKSPLKIKEIIKKELKQIKDNFGDERKTKVHVQKIGEIAEEDLIPQEETVIALTQGGYVKRINPDVYKMQKRGGKGMVGMKTLGEDVVEHFLTAMTHDSLLFFTDSGKVFRTQVYEIPEGQRVAKGRGLLNFLEISAQDKVLSLQALGKEDNKRGIKYLVMATKDGIIKKTAIEEFENVRKSGLIAITLKKGDSLRKVAKTTGVDEIILITKKGQSIRFKESALRPMGRTAAGVHGIRLKKDDEIIGMDVIPAIAGKQSPDDKKENKYLLVVAENGYGKRTDLKEYRIQSRGGSGIKTAQVTPKTGDLVAAKVLNGREEELIVISRKGQVIKTTIQTIAKVGRATQGVRIMRLDAGDKVASAACI